MLLSIVLPVYNVEAYLPKCIESCENQDLSKSDYEVIIVIDGSPDHSIDVAKQYQLSFDNIKIVTKKNGGQSSARNTGLEVASGSYVWFVDPDDFIEENILGRIIKKLHDGDLDILWIDWQDIDENGNIISPFAPHAYCDNNTVMKGTEFMSKVLNNYLYAWCFIYRRSFLLEHALRFTEGMYYEDADFAFRSLPLVRRIQRYKKICYNYLQRENSTVHHTDMRKLKDISKNCVTATNALRTCEQSLKRFYQICFTSFYMLFLKEVLKSKNKGYANFLMTETQLYSFGRVSLFGNFKTKLIGMFYNLFGVRATLRILGFLIK